MEKIKLLKVEFLPNDLKSGILYVSDEYGVAGHLCPCGCENKIITPLDSFEWSFEETDNEATLFPSIGNWQLPCKSHYWIRKGRIKWSYEWSGEEISAGQEAERRKREEYFDKNTKEVITKSVFRKLLDWCINLF